jgi:hypothetical protein
MAKAHFLIFVDTNILLDFYRVRGREAGLSILKHIDDNLDRFIITNQVEMEFKKNRQRVILDTDKVFKMPNWEGLKLPGFLAESKQSTALSKNQAQIKKLSGTLRSRMGKVLKQPTTQDAVYKTAQRLFKHSSPLNLSRDKKARFAVRRLAWKRFMLGYPPRKDGDTSIGDAINWEWIVKCAESTGNHVVIVSRDSDFGISFNGESILNDWLLQEFRERVSKKRKVVLTDRLSAGLKAAAITVTKQEEKSEEEFLESRSSVVAGKNLLFPQWLTTWGEQAAGSTEGFRKIAESLLKSSEEIAKAYKVDKDDGGDT